MHYKLLKNLIMVVIDEEELKDLVAAADVSDYVSLMIVNNQTQIDSHIADNRHTDNHRHIDNRETTSSMVNKSLQLLLRIMVDNVVSCWYY